MGRICEGYQSVPPKTSRAVVPRTLAPAPAVNSPIEPHALEFFFTNTAPQLAGYFEHAFFQGSVLQLSLTEPAIRQAIAALGILHEQATWDNIQHPQKSQGRNLLFNLPINLYNGAIRSIIERVTADPDNLLLVAMINILFICLEYFQNNLQATATHIRAGINILNDWRARSRKGSGQSCVPSQKYASFETEFMETEIAPLLCNFNLNAVHWGVEMRPGLLLTPADDPGGLIMTGRFESLKSARAALLNLVIFGTCQFEPFAMEPSNKDFPVISERVMNSLSQWKASFEDLFRRQWHLWDKQKRRTADALSAIQHNAEFGVYSYQAQGDCNWEKYRAHYEKAAALVNGLATDTNHRVFSLDFGMTFPLQPMAWTCRWPHLHRAGLDLRARLPELDWLPEPKQYLSVSSRITEIEEAYLGLSASKRHGDQIPSEDFKIQDYSVAAPQEEEGHSPSFAVTFWSKPDGPDGPWYCFTENMHLGTGRSEQAASLDNEACKKSGETPNLLGNMAPGDPSPPFSSFKTLEKHPRKCTTNQTKEEEKV